MSMKHLISYGLIFNPTDFSNSADSDQMDTKCVIWFESAPFAIANHLFAVYSLWWFRFIHVIIMEAIKYSDRKLLTLSMHSLTGNF